MDIEEESGNPLNDIFSALRRYYLPLLIAIPIILVIAITYVMMIPPIYRSTGQVMVQTQQIPTNLVQSTITSAASEQIDIITQRVLTREKILKIVKSNDYFGINEDDLVQQSRVLQQFKANVDVSVTSANSGRQRVAIGFSVSFDSDTPTVAQAVATELTKLFLIENVKARTTRASETTEFLYSEAEKMRLELEKIEGEVAEFKRTNKDSLPEHLDLYVGMQEDTRRNLALTSEALFAKDDQIRLLQNKLAYANKTGVVSVNGMGFEEELATLRDQYRMLSLEYQPNHPDLLILKQKIELLENGDAGKELFDMESHAQQEMKTQLSTLIEQRKYLADEKNRISDKLEDLEQRIIRIPQVEREFTEINRNYQTIEEQYKSLQAKAQSAAMAESLEQQQKAERFDILEAPALPVRPFKPDRKKLLLFAIAVSVGLPVGLVVLVGFLDRSIRDSDALEKITGAPPLAEIPIVSTKEELLARRQRFVIGACCAALIIAIGLTSVNFLVIPLDEVASTVVTRFGI